MKSYTNFVNLILYLLLATFVNISSVFGQTEPPQFFTLDGRLFEAGSATEPLLDASVVMTIQILNPAKTCILYEETETVNTLGTNGFFTARIGSATSATERAARDSNNSMKTVFVNAATPITGQTSGGGGCSYTPAAGDVREFRFFITPSTVGSTAQLSDDMTVDSVPQALVAQSLQGLEPSDVFQTSATSTQVKLDNLLTTNYTTLSNVISGTSNLYLRNAATGTQLPTRATDPGAPAAGQIWYDTATNEIKYYNGSTVQAVGAAGSGITSITAGAGLDGGTITTSGTVSIATGGVTNAMLASGINASKITAGTLPVGVVPTGTDTTKLPLDGSVAMTGALDMGAQNLLNTGHITMNAQRTITIGRYDSTQQTTLIGTLTGANAGAAWFNLTTGKLMYWDGAAALELSETTSAGGDITAINTNAGSGLTGGVTAGPATLAINVDGSTIEVATNTVQLKDAGITNAKLASDAVTTAKLANDAVTGAKILNGEITDVDINAAAAIAWSKIDKTGATAADVGAVPTARQVNTNSGSGLAGGGDLSANRNLSINVDNSTIEIATNTVQVKDGGITNSKINSVSVAKITSGAGDYFSYMPAGAECATGEILKWNAASDRWLCDTDAVGATDHGALTGLSDDDHTQYVMLAGRAGGQNLRGGNASGDDLIIESTSDATKGDVILQPSGGNVGIGTTAPSSEFHFSSTRTAGTPPHLLIESSKLGSNGASVLMRRSNSTFQSLLGFQTGVSGSDGFVGALPNRTGDIYMLSNVGNTQPGIGVTTADGFVVGTATGLRAGTFTAQITSSGDGYFSGNVGIGTTAPSANLEVAGTILTSAAAPSIRFYESDQASGSRSWYAGVNGMEYILVQGRSDDFSAGGGDTIVVDRGAGNALGGLNANKSGISFFNLDFTTGRVGIGTTN
ncbi:MAG: hypothetical protein IT287_01660, partial [Bdellovibrionaceae bacterium]|nr:hypothetical protein [Pseudobdellovibrionaceae bacterium]